MIRPRSVIVLTVLACTEPPQAPRDGIQFVDLDRLLGEQAVDAQSAHLAWELAMGVVRRRGTLDAVIDAFQKRRDAPMPQRVRQVLRLGAYQILFLDRVPVFAAVHAAVEALVGVSRFDPAERLGDFVRLSGKSVAIVGRMLAECGFDTVAYWGRPLVRLAGDFTIPRAGTAA